MEEQKDQKLWRMAQQRATFKRNLYTYIVVILFLWCVWWLTQGSDYEGRGIPWPVWPMLGWGLGVAFHYFKAYYGGKEGLAAREYERLKQQQSRG